LEDIYENILESIYEATPYGDSILWTGSTGKSKEKKE